MDDELGQFWRPEFDDHIVPLLPPHVSRPKENIKILKVTLPPRCVIGVPRDTVMEFVPVPDIPTVSSDEEDEILRSLPFHLSRYSLKFLNFV
jgi:hypothetical protein